MMDHFNQLVYEQYDHRTHLALRFSRPLMKRAHREAMLRDGKFFKPEWDIKTAEELMAFKRSRAMPDIIEAKRDNAMELYVSHDVGSVRNHFFEKENVPKFK